MSVVPHSFSPRGIPVPPRVLVVDDSEPTARALAALLDGASYQAVTALRGRDALERAAASPTFAAAIVDIHLPDMSGLEVTRRLRELLGPGVPIIVLSGDSSMDVLTRLPDAGATHFFSKPVNAGMLLERLNQSGSHAG